VKDARSARHHCVVCELFGCTDWGRKFRFEVRNGQGQTQAQQIKASSRFELRFTVLRPVRAEEEALLDLTLRLIAEYGALGGKTVFKPSKINSSKLHHRDFGLIKLVTASNTATTKREDLHAFVQQGRWRKVEHCDFAWASLMNFWCVPGRHLSRESDLKSSFNREIGRPDPKSQAQGDDSWLAGRRARSDGGRRARSDAVQPESKKVFSFRQPQRTFGFVKPGTIGFGEIKSRLRIEWPTLQDSEFLTGEEILRRLTEAAIPS
jgi:CRISPR-associated protein Cmr1